MIIISIVSCTYIHCTYKFSRLIRSKKSEYYGQKYSADINDSEKACPGALPTWMQNSSNLITNFIIPLLIKRRYLLNDRIYDYKFIKSR